MAIRHDEPFIVNNMLTQIGVRFKTGRGKSSAVFMCDCGVTKIVRYEKVLLGHTKSCGCIAGSKGGYVRTNHGHTKGGKHSGAYKSWAKMLARCKAKPGSHHWPYYGAKGITVCERWKRFENFYADMGDRPEGCTIDRIDGSKGYGPDNCRWATKAVQCLNVSDIRMIEFEGVTLCLKDWARRVGLKYLTLWNRINSGWSIEKALTTPVRKMKCPCNP